MHFAFWAIGDSLRNVSDAQLHMPPCHFGLHDTTLLGILGRALDTTEDAGCVPAQRHAPHAL
jgi:hypothetical protein